MIIIKKKGHFLLEIIIVMGVVSLVVSFIFFKYNKIKEKQDLERAINIIENVIYRYSLKSLDSLEKFDIKLNYKTKELSVKPKGLTNVIERFELPQKLNYVTFDNKMEQDEENLSTNTNGNFSNSFSIYICGYNNAVTYKITFYIFEKSLLGKINIYKNVTGEKIKYEDLYDFHYNGKGGVREGWIKI